MKQLFSGMFLPLAHTRLDIFAVSQTLVKDVYTLTKTFPKDEQYGLVQQLRRAAVSVHLNIAEGCSRKSDKERHRFFEIARGSVIEIDTAISISVELQILSSDEAKETGQSLIRCFQMLSKMIHT
jgi:four helix bundle protein